MTRRLRLAAMAAICTVLVGAGVFSGSFLGLRALAGPSMAEVGGVIDTDTTWTVANSPYVVTSSVLVQQGVTLTINPGVEVKFNGGTSLRIDGELIAQGASDNKITFTSNQTTPDLGDWGCIFFTNTSTDAVVGSSGNYVGGSILRSVILERLRQ